jgi:hypothetical protein
MDHPIPTRTIETHQPGKKVQFINYLKRSVNNHKITMLEVTNREVGSSDTYLILFSSQIGSLLIYANDKL